MAPKFRKALGAVKDRTSIILAKVSGNTAPRLHKAIIKATSHSNKPANDRHLREVLNMTFYSSDCVGASIDILSRRLGKTRDWVVALKALMLVHRLLTDGHPAFHHEILYANRRGAHLLNMADFCDNAHSNSWDHSAFIRTYALYLDQNLECMIYQRKRGGGSSCWNEFTIGHERFLQPTPYEYRDHDLCVSESCGMSPYSSSSRKGEVRCDEQQDGDDSKAPKTLRDMKIERVLDRMYELQRLLNRFFACRPTGNAMQCRMILVALHPIIRESFQLYADICEVLDILLDRFFDLDYLDCVKSFDAYASAARQIDELCAFYNWCKNMGVARTSDYPEVRRVTKKLLESLKEFTRDKARRLNSPPTEEILEPEAATDEEVDQDTVSMKAHPTPSNYEEEEPKPSKALAVELVKQREEADLLDLSDDVETIDEQSNKLALALFQGPMASCETFPPSTGVTSAWQNPAAEIGNADWEIVLVDTHSNLSNQRVTLGGGLDQLLLSSMYDQGAVRQQLNAQVNNGSASSVVSGQGGAPVLSLQAVEQTIGQDPFAASLGIAPPSYVQMADIENKQQLLVQEQALWQPYAYTGMQAQPSLINHSNPFLPNPTMAYGMPVAYNTVGGYYYQTY